MSYYNDAIYFGVFSMSFDEYGNPMIDHEIGACWIRQTTNENNEKIIINEWHLGDGIYESI